MALSEADIDELIEEILNGSQELYVAAMSSLMVSHFMKGVSKLKDEAALLHLTNQFPQQAKTILMQYQDVISDEIKRAVEDALKDSVAADLDQLKKIYGDDASKMAEHYWKQGATKHFVEVAKKTADQVAEIVRRQNILMEENAEKTWYAVTKDAVNEAVLGTKLRDKIVADAVTRLMDEGIKTIDYGHDGRPTVSNEVDVAVKRHIVSQVSQVGSQLSMDAMESYNHKFAITSAHYGARPSHARWQGLPGCLTGEVVVDSTKYPDFYVLTGYEGKRGPNVALGDRLKGVNCRHSVYPFFPGITQLPDREFKEAQKKWGKSSDDYYADLQHQRELERRIRKTKREIAGMEQAGLDLDNPDYVQKRLKLGKQQKSLKEWCDKNKLTRQPKREKAFGVLKQPRALKSTNRYKARRISRYNYPVTQKQIDEVLNNELSGVRLTAKPTYSGRIRTPGKTTISYTDDGKKYISAIQIGKQASDSKKELIDTILHEELEARIAINKHSSEKYWALNESTDDERHAYIQRVIDKYIKMKGL